MQIQDQDYPYYDDVYQDDESIETEFHALDTYVVEMLNQA